MTRKHFRDLADRLDSLRPQGEPPCPILMAWWRRTVHSMANFCAAQNGRFNRGRFLTACGYTPAGNNT